ncbi:hypothetical protein [Fonticella tunisiensis]|uniref:Uncharacterized protein n=1 Tax=Fonticella tunisiensis TaxID=1096341 RepID=A0A4R7KC33_9CLOT|nr:hypothetical protein [Fonticella tunisiensis]TDT51351.1 hypothetical protein EDD71_11835 [Fonticella tunisiensis]
MEKRFKERNLEDKEAMVAPECKGKYRFGTGISLIDGNILSAPDIERTVNGMPLSDETEDDKID